jgi:integrase
VPELAGSVAGLTGVFGPGRRNWCRSRTGCSARRHGGRAIWRLAPFPAGSPASARLRVEHAGLHRLRHGVATYLVDHGRLLKAQARLGHADPATTLRHYSHATPLDDTDVADELDRLLNDLAQSTDHGE